jgi:hypothetical protein
VRFVLAVDERSAATLDEDTLFEDAPEDFCDPLLCTLMEDPVLTPYNHVFDRSSILTHLLNDSSDPLSRQPMTASDLKPATELKAKIEAWKEEKKRLARGEAPAVSAAAAVPVLPPAPVQPVSQCSTPTPQECLGAIGGSLPSYEGGGSIGSLGPAAAGLSIGSSIAPFEEVQHEVEGEGEDADLMEALRLSMLEQGDGQGEGS